MKTTLLASAVLAFAVGMSSAAMAAGNAYGLLPPGYDLPEGQNRYDAIAPHANDAAQCGSGAGSGAFGFLGKDANMGIKSDPTDPGANGVQTGINNSSVCGNRPN
jgi:hypothetical protein